MRSLRCVAFLAGEMKKSTTRLQHVKPCHILYPPPLPLLPTFPSSSRGGKNTHQHTSSLISLIPHSQSPISLSLSPLLLHTSCHARAKKPHHPAPRSRTYVRTYVYIYIRYRPAAFLRDIKGRHLAHASSK